MRVFSGDDWAEAQHDVHVMTEGGDRLAAKRLPEGLEGIAGDSDAADGMRTLVEVIAGLNDAIADTPDRRLTTYDPGVSTR